MATGLAAGTLANLWLNMLSGSAFTAPTNTYVKLHNNVGDPGAAGASNPSANTTRVILAWSAAAAGSKSITATLPVWAAWAAGSETIAYMSVWDAITAGNFLYSFALTTPKAMTNGDTLTLTSHSISLTPLAA
jgi:hypothetical protein